MSDVFRLHRMRRVTVFVPVCACLVGLAFALDNGDTWQRSLVTALLYGAAARLSLVLVTLRPVRPRAESRPDQRRI